MTLTAAMQEAYAANPGGEIVIETLELDHVTFEAPVRIAANVDEDVALPLTSGGPDVAFKALAVSVTLPGVSEDGPTPMRIRIDNVSGYLLPYLRAAIQSTAPIGVIYRAYTSIDLSAPGDVIDGLQLRSVDLTATSAEGAVGFREIEMEAFPRRTYDQTFYPALSNL